MTKNSRQKNIVPSLAREIIFDLVVKHWFVMGLVVIAIMSAMFQAKTTHDTRIAIAESQKLREERQNLEIKWQALRLELTSLTEANRVESEAKNKLKMIKVNSDNEKIISL